MTSVPVLDASKEGLRGPTPAPGATTLRAHRVLRFAGRRFEP